MPSLNRAAIYSVLLAALFVHITLLRFVSLAGYAPDLLLIVVIFLALFFGPGAGLEAGIFAGLGKDIFAFDYMGANTLTLAVTGLTVGLLNSNFFKESKLTRVIIVFFFSAFSMSMHLLIYNTLSASRDISFIDYATSPLLPVCLYTAFAALLLFPVLEGVFGVRESRDII